MFRLGFITQEAAETPEYSRTPDSHWNNRELVELPYLEVWKWHLDVGQGLVVNMMVLRWWLDSKILLRDLRPFSLPPLMCLTVQDIINAPQHSQYSSTTI